MTSSTDTNSEIIELTDLIEKGHAQPARSGEGGRAVHLSGTELADVEKKEPATPAEQKEETSQPEQTSEPASSACEELQRELAAALERIAALEQRISKSNACLSLDEVDDRINVVLTPLWGRTRALEETWEKPDAHTVAALLNTPVMAQQLNDTVNAAVADSLKKHMEELGNTAGDGQPAVSAVDVAAELAVLREQDIPEAAAQAARAESEKIVQTLDGLRAQILDLQASDAARQARLDEIERRLALLEKQGVDNAGTDLAAEVETLRADTQKAHADLAAQVETLRAHAQKTADTMVDPAVRCDSIAAMTDQPRSEDKDLERIARLERAVDASSRLVSMLEGTDLEGRIASAVQQAVSAALDQQADNRQMLVTLTDQLQDVTDRLQHCEAQLAGDEIEQAAAKACARILREEIAAITGGAK